MNKIEANVPTLLTPRVTAGTLVRWDTSVLKENVYMVCQVALDQFQLISLDGGNRYADQRVALADLRTYLKENQFSAFPLDTTVKITVKA